MFPLKNKRQDREKVLPFLFGQKRMPIPFYSGHFPPLNTLSTLLTLPSCMCEIHIWGYHTIKKGSGNK
ncbi:MAG: hypothetical protein B6245_19155 [Desulfobacteraceae bacterium 4572_88]|nr:MAG: hypothetical protein B6245_19155 [Desulfobacteraceae bacterium 4572_88]RLC18502.1 MAG: hypothetical protein DRI57_08350 [Deltaproteobacteria bacterium]